MMKYLFFTLVACSLLIGCNKPAVTRNEFPTTRDTIAQPPRIDTIVQPPPPPADTNAATKHFLALGDSYTFGQSVMVQDRFPMQTVKALTALSINFAAPEIFAKTGWTTSNLLNTINAIPPERLTYDAVSLLIGVNNQYQHLSQAQYSTEFTTLLTKAIGYAGNNAKRVFVLSIPDYSVTPFANGSNKALIASQIDSFNVINLNIALQYGVHYLNITTSSRQAASDPSLVATDGLHPSGKEYKKWADLLAPMIQAALQ
jgi:lysophospholipase L1-like esterase